MHRPCLLLRVLGPLSISLCIASGQKISETAESNQHIVPRFAQSQLAIQRSRIFTYLKSTSARTIDEVVKHPLAPLPLWVTLMPMSELPVTVSDAVVIGSITTSVPQLTEDRKVIYTESTVAVNRVLKGSLNNTLSPKASIVVLTIGGSATLENGKTVRQDVLGFGNPLSRQTRYVWFLKHHPTADAYTVLKTWALIDSGGRAVWADDLGRIEKGASRVQGMHEDRLIEEVYNAASTRR